MTPLKQKKERPSGLSFAAFHPITQGARMAYIIKIILDKFK